MALPGFDLGVRSQLWPDTPATAQRERDRTSKTLVERAEGAAAAQEPNGNPAVLEPVRGDLHAHPVAYFLESLLAGLDPGKVDVFCYHNHRRWDVVTDRLRAHATGWKLIAGLSDAEPRGRSAPDGVNVLVDLSGHTGATACRCSRASRRRCR